MSDESLDQIANDNKLLLLQGFADIAYPDGGTTVEVTFDDGIKTAVLQLPVVDILENKTFSRTIDGKTITFVGLLITHTDERLQNFKDYVSFNQFDISSLSQTRFLASKVPPGAPGYDEVPS